MSGGSGEQAELMAGCGQMGRYNKLPTRVAAGMADAKFPDAQSGFEKDHPQTFNIMQKEYIYPEVADRTSPKEWAENGKQVLIET